MAFPAQPPDLRRLSFGRESFAVSCPLALLGNASYPVSVRRLNGFATPLLSALPSRENALRFASVPTTKFREDFHLRTIAHAGHTREERRAMTMTRRSSLRPSPLSPVAFAGHAANQISRILAARLRSLWRRRSAAFIFALRASLGFS